MIFENAEDLIVDPDAFAERLDEIVSQGTVVTRELVWLVDRRVLGTFGVYHRDVRLPTVAEREAVRTLAIVAACALECAGARPGAWMQAAETRA